MHRPLSNCDLVLLGSLGSPASSHAACSVLAAHLGLVGMFGSAINSSPSEKSESACSTNSLLLEVQVVKRLHQLPLLQGVLLQTEHTFQ